jgi:hypothetical protein
MSERKFYRCTTTITWLSETHPGWAYDGSLESLSYALTEGQCVLHTHEEAAVEVDGPEMARLLDEAGSEPAFFMLTPDGQDDL